MNPNGISGELAFKVESIRINSPGDKHHDLTFKTADGNFLHICGENNMVELLENAIKTYQEEEMIIKVQQAMANNSKPIF